MAVQWADVSEYQRVVDDTYPHPVFAIRSNDGTYRDRNFAANYAWAKRALSDGRLAALIVYCVYRPNWQQTGATMQSMVGPTPPAGVVVMIDVESWGGQIVGDQSAQINALHAQLAQWLGHPSRVIAYGNKGDLNSLWPNRPPGVGLVVAAYGSVPTYPGMIGHQFSDSELCAPFGPCDGNNAGQHTIESLTAALGIGAPARKDRVHMQQLPATAVPTDPNSSPATWPERNYDVGFLGPYAFAFGAQEWNGRTTDPTRAFLYLASWIMPDGSLRPVDPIFTTAGKGHTIADHWPTPAYTAPANAVGVTLNYAAPGGAYVAES